MRSLRLDVCGMPARAGGLPPVGCLLNPRTMDIFVNDLSTATQSLKVIVNILMRSSQ